MTREEEIQIILDYIKFKVNYYSENYPNLLLEKVVYYSPIIIKYKDELEQLKKEKGL
jgi:hypothetical protein